MEATLFVSQTDGFLPKCSKEPKSTRKKVSFIDTVTDINDSYDCEIVAEDDDDNKRLEEIFNVSERINFFNQAVKTDSGKASPQPPSSIPQARLAFVTEMVGAAASAASRYGSAVARAQRGAGDGCYVVAVEVPCAQSPPPIEAEMELHQTRIFASATKRTPAEPAVDSSSILEHREELRDLWEKRMMADDQSSPPSAAKTKQEGDGEGAVVATLTTAKSEEGAVVMETTKAADANPHKMSNGFLKNTERDNDITATYAGKENVDADLENNNSADSLDEDEDGEGRTDAAPRVIEKVESTSATNQDVEKDKDQDKVAEDKKVSKPSNEQPLQDPGAGITVKSDAALTVTEAATVDVAASPDVIAVSADVTASTEVITASVGVTTSPDVKAVDLDVAAENEGTESSDEVILQQEHEAAEADGKIGDGLRGSAEGDGKFGDGIRGSVEAGGKIGDGLDGRGMSAEETAAAAELSDDKAASKDAAVEDDDEVDELLIQIEDVNVKAIVQDADVVEDILWEKIDSSDALEGEIEAEDSVPEKDPTPAKPDPAAMPDEKSRIEELVNGGLKRVMSGVQSTEQPYSTCTTETKIAMEIREMREREEELRVMRENALTSPLPPSPLPITRTPSPSLKDLPVSGPGYRVSSVFGHKGASPSPPPAADDDKKPPRGFSKESAVEKEIRLARDREEELRRQQGLPPREDDSYVKPSQVKSSQVRVFGKLSSSPKQAATAKIQLEIEEQTQREMALRDTGHIQTISQERTDAKVAKLKELNVLIPELNYTNGEYHSLTNGHLSPDSNIPKRQSPSPTGPRSLPPTKGISMQKFIATRGRETTFSAPKVNGVTRGEDAKSVVPPTTVKLKRNLSVESKIQQEIVEMKQREDELRKLHMNRKNENYTLEKNNNDEIDLVMNQKNNLEDYENGFNDEEISPRHNKLIAQWEQRIQKAES